MHPSKSIRRFLASIPLAGIVVLAASSAAARPEAPGELQAAANMQCVPLCTMCHTTNPGQVNNWVATRSLVQALVTPIKAEADIKPAYGAWAQMNPALASLVQRGIEPTSGADVCGPTYGCAVRVEKEAAAPRDFSGPLWVVGAVVAGAVLRRRRRKPAVT